MLVWLVSIHVQRTTQKAEFAKISIGVQVIDKEQEIVGIGSHNFKSVLKQHIHMQISRVIDSCCVGCVCISAACK